MVEPHGTKAVCKRRIENGRVVIDLAAETVLEAGKKLEVAL